MAICGSRAGEAVTLVLKDEIDISRGDLLVDAHETLAACRALPWMWCGWLNSRCRGPKHDIKIAGKKTRARVDGIQFQVDINNLTQREVTGLPLNGIGLVDLTLTNRWCWINTSITRSPVG
jgi:sulfate adenylyltransferase subunit 1